MARLAVGMSDAMKENDRVFAVSTSGVVTVFDRSLPEHLTTEETATKLTYDTESRTHGNRAQA